VSLHDYIRKIEEKVADYKKDKRIVLIHRLGIIFKIVEGISTDDYFVWSIIEEPEQSE